jgi:hypothetical protein
MERPALLRAALLAVAVFGAGCRSQPGAETGAGALELSLTFDPGAVPADAPATWFHLLGATASGDRWESWLRAAPGAGGHTADATVPSGSYEVGARLFVDAGADPAVAPPDLLTPADVPVAVAAGGSQRVALRLEPTPWRAAAVRRPNNPPTVYAIVATPSLVDTADPAAVVTLAVSAIDPDGDRLSYAWTAVDARATAVCLGSFRSPTAQRTRWTPPPGFEGTVVFTAAARDARGASASLSTTIKAAPLSAFGSVAVVAGVNRAPDVGPIQATEAELPPLGVTTVAAAAFDADGDLLAYAWSDGGCGGTFDAEGAASVTAWHAPASARDCTLTVTVSDLDRITRAPRGAATRSTLVLHVVTAVGRAAPEFVLAARAPAGLVSAGPVSFRVIAVEPAADLTGTVAVTAISWSDGTGRVGVFTPEVAGRWDAVAWTPPDCPPGATGSVALTVTATATGSAGDRASYGFAVERGCP